jgi:hypothetical protein
MALGSLLLLAACGGGDEADEAATTERSTTTEATTTTTAPTTAAPTTTETAPPEVTVPEEMSATQSSLAEQLAGADLEEIEAILATDEGRAAFTETILELAPTLTEEQVGCFLDSFDLTLLGTLQSDPSALEPETIISILTVLGECEIPLTAFTDA